MVEEGSLTLRVNTELGRKKMFVSHFSKDKIHVCMYFRYGGSNPLFTVKVLKVIGGGLYNSCRYIGTHNPQMHIFPSKL